jgi:serine/threonine-protein kinase
LTGKAPLDFDCDRTTGELLWQDSLKLSPSFAKILNKMLKISLQERYKSVSTILQALQENSPQDNLSQYLITRQQPLPEKTISHTQNSTDSLRSPAAKAAVAIREWKTRMEEKKQQRQRLNNEKLANETSNSI